MATLILTQNWHLFTPHLGTQTQTWHLAPHAWDDIDPDLANNFSRWGDLDPDPAWPWPRPGTCTPVTCDQWLRSCTCPPFIQCDLKPELAPVLLSLPWPWLGACPPFCSCDHDQDLVAVLLLPGGPWPMMPAWPRSYAQGPLTFTGICPLPTWRDLDPDLAPVLFSADE